MSLRTVSGAILLVLAAAACAESDSPGADGAWVGTITAEGDVTTVVNESGSVWGGPATLVEEASIGVDNGPEEYMLGLVASVYANDERLAVLDATTNIVRMYDRAGRFLFNVGGAGQGPGEYSGASTLTMDAAGKTYVYDSRGRRLSSYTLEGAFERSWDFSGFGCCAWSIHPRPPDLLWLPIVERDPETGERRYGAQLFSHETGERTGQPMLVPEIDFPETTHEIDGRQSPTPFSPSVRWATTPAGGLVAGATDRYRFEILHTDGAKTIVERVTPPVRIEAEEREWHRRLTVAMIRRGGDGFDWDGAEIPYVHPAFDWLTPAVTGEIWVSRVVGNTRREVCMENPIEDLAGASSITRCFVPLLAFDVFGADGRYLGEVELPEPRPFPRFVDGDTVIGYVEDAAGTIMVKRYRLVPPGEE